MNRIAIIEDDRLFNEALSISFEKAGYEVLKGFSVSDGRNLVALHPDIMLLDMGLPDGSGIDVCKYVKAVSDAPVLFLTAKDEEIDMIHAYDVGCDDYVVKPFPMEVLRKKVDAILKLKDADRDTLRFRELTIDYRRRAVHLGNTEISLSPKEFGLLEYMSRNKGHILSKEKLLENVWDAEGSFVDDNTVNVTVNRLRKKIESDDNGDYDSGKTKFINNVFGMGYRFGD